MIIEKLTKSETIKSLISKERITTFIIVGIVGTCVDLFCTLVSVEFLGLNEIYAAILGAEIAIVVMFLLNNRFTFRSSKDSDIYVDIKRLAKSQSIRFGTSILQICVFILVYRVTYVQIEINGIDMWIIAAKLCGIILAGFANYTFECMFTWKVQE